nr:conserved hypothetical protein, UPF0179 family [uncultured archaeon]
MEEGRIVTLIGAKYAKVGEEFFFLGLSERCELCKLKHSCMTLVIDRRYRIEKVRDEIKHDCYIHENGVCVVEVIEPPVKVAIEAKFAFKNSKIVFMSPKCEETDCELYDSCHPAGLREGDNCTIIEVTDDPSVACKKGRTLKVVKMLRERK